MLDKLDIEQFKALENATFSIFFEADKAMEAQLVKVEALKGDTDLDRSPFSLIFETNQKDSYYTQAIYQVTHPRLEALHLFIVPLGKSERGMRYEVVFS